MMLIVRLLAGWGVSDAVAKKLAPFAAAAGVLAILGLLWAAWGVFDHFNDRAAIKGDRIERQAAEAESALKRERAASAADKERAEARTAASAETFKRLEDIEDANPAAAKAPAPAGSRAVADRLRRNGDRRH